MKLIKDDFVVTDNMKRVAYKSIVSLVVLLIIMLLWNRMFITIPAGHSGVFFDRFKGTQVDKVYSEGIYTILPWNFLSPYETRVQERRHEFKVLSKTGLTIVIKVSIRFRPDVNMLGVLHQKVGPNYIESIVVPETESIIRKYFGKFTDEEIYTSKKGVMKKIYNEAKDKMANKYIILDDLIIKGIEFSQDVKDAIENKAVEFHRYKEMSYRVLREELEAKRKIIEAEGIHRYKTIISKNLTKEFLQYEGIQATLELAQSDNAKIIVIGGGKDGLPLLLNGNN